MPLLTFETTIRAPLSAVWAFHDDPITGVPALSPPDARVEVESADVPVREGSRIIFTAQGPLGRLRWVARIVEHRPPHAVVFGEEARFVDVQESGPFKYWRHEHEFEAVDQSSTRIVDRVSYSVGWGPLGWLADKLLVARKVREMFRHRHAATRKLLEG